MPPILPKTDIQKAMEVKNKSISKFQDNKEKAITLMSCGRDAVLMTTAQDCTKLSDDELKEKVKMWRRWFYYELYGVEPDVELTRENKNKPDSVPFK